MTTSRRRLAISHGQLTSEFRSRVRSGFPSDPYADLEALVADIGEPCWLSGPTAAALHCLDGFVLADPHHVIIPRGRNVRRVGIIVHTSEQMSLIDRGAVR